MSQDQVTDPTNTPRCIETVSGKFVDPLDPDFNSISIEDIAWALSRISRFAGHTITKVPYNVGQHSVFVYSMIKKDFPHDHFLQGMGLLHDAAEAFIGDIPSPVKYSVPGLYDELKKVENRIERMIFKKFLGDPSEEEIQRNKKMIKFYDKKAQFIEAYNFMPSRGLNWVDRSEYNISILELHDFNEVWEPSDSYQIFLDEYGYLSL